MIITCIAVVVAAAAAAAAAEAAAAVAALGAGAAAPHRESTAVAAPAGRLFGVLLTHAVDSTAGVLKCDNLVCDAQ